jgi:hypothetical protein
LEAAVGRGDVSDEEWAINGVLLPSERGRKARSSHDNRWFLNGILPIIPLKANRRLRLPALPRSQPG